MIGSIERTSKFFRGHPVAAGQMVSTWWRWLAWQLRSRVSRGPHVVDWIGDTKLVVEKGMTGATGNLYCGLHEFADMAFVLHFLSGMKGSKSTSRFVDVGANVGTYTVLAAGVCRTPTICIEPAQATFDALQRNVQENQLEDLVEACPTAVGDQPGEIRFSTDRDSPMNQVVDDDYPGSFCRVPVCLLDSLLRGRTATLVKIDVEGFEEQVLRGCQAMLADPATQAILLEEGSHEIQTRMRDAGFIQADYDPIARQVIVGESKIHLGNHLWLRDAKTVTELCQNGRRFSVFGFDF